MIHRFAAALLLCVSLAACKENDTPIGQQLFKGSGDVQRARRPHRPDRRRVGGDLRRNARLRDRARRVHQRLRASTRRRRSSSFYLIDRQEQPLSGQGQRLVGLHRRQQLDDAAQEGREARVHDRLPHQRPQRLRDDLLRALAASASRSRVRASRGRLRRSHRLGFRCVAPAGAARPLPDSGKWDRTFALYARDVAVPWKRIAVRLDTYSGAPVDFAAYEVDPADVLVAGTRARARRSTRRTAPPSRGGASRRRRACATRPTTSRCRCRTAKGSSSSKRGAATRCSRRGSTSRASVC